MTVRLPIPRAWQDFESICHQLWKDIWSDPNAQKNGRSGQEQHGVDIYGCPIYDPGYAGVQCKDKDGRLGRTLSEAELFAECQEAQYFEPSLNSFTVATTAPRDASIQKSARELNAKGRYPFDVHVWSWDDIETEILCRPQLLNGFYSALGVEQQEPNIVRLAASAPREQLFAFFGRPQVTDTLPGSLRDRLVQVVYELSDNAFSHGRATRFELSFNGVTLEMCDDGAPFNPISELDPAKKSAVSHVGSYVFDSFQSTFERTIETNYRRLDTETTSLNCLSFKLTEPVHQYSEPEILDVSVDLRLAYGRNAARRLAQTIPVSPGVKELVLTVGAIRNVSAFVEFVNAMLSRLPAGMKLTVSLPRVDYIEGFDDWFHDARLSIQPR